MSHHVLDFVFGLGWATMRGILVRFSHVVGRITPVDILKSNILALLTNGNFQMVL